MNYLAHIFLSRNIPKIQIGNFIADFVKGNKISIYPLLVQDGIRLHRKIDTYTDNHLVVLDTKKRLYPVFGRYSGIVLDVYFDHFLAINFKKFAPSQNLICFSLSFYATLIFNYYLLPDKVKSFVWHFILTNRLVTYSKIEGIEKSFAIMQQFKTPAISSHDARKFLESHYDYLNSQFQLFFTDLIEYLHSEI
jgi:acyl carrier protein phosphodiesterase